MTPSQGRVSIVPGPMSAIERRAWAWLLRRAFRRSNLRQARHLVRFWMDNEQDGWSPLSCREGRHSTDTNDGICVCGLEDRRKA